MSRIFGAALWFNISRRKSVTDGSQSESRKSEGDEELARGIWMREVGT